MLDISASGIFTYGEKIFFCRCYCLYYKWSSRTSKTIQGNKFRLILRVIITQIIYFAFSNRAMSPDAIAAAAELLPKVLSHLSPRPAVICNNSVPHG